MSEDVRGPEDEQHHREQRGRHDPGVAAVLDSGPERVVAHAATVPAAARGARPRPSEPTGGSHVETLIVERADGVVRLVLNRPEKKNAINGVMWEELLAVFAEVRDRTEDRVLVITGAGAGFCTGADLSGTGGDGTAPAGLGGALAGMRTVGRTAQALHELPKPTIAAVNGVAAGAGCNLALGCDLVIASTRAAFSEIFTKRGLTVDFGGSWLLPKLVGLHRAKELVFLAEVIDAATADRIGLVNHVVEPEALDTFVADLAARLAALPPIAIALSKRLLEQSAAVSFAQAVEFEAVAQVAMMHSRDTVEAVTAFLEKREARYTGE